MASIDFRFEQVCIGGEGLLFMKLLIQTHYGFVDELMPACEFTSFEPIHFTSFTATVP